MVTTLFYVYVSKDLYAESSANPIQVATEVTQR